MEKVRMEEMLREAEKRRGKEEYWKEMKRLEQERRRQERIYGQLAQQPPDWPRG